MIGLRPYQYESVARIIAAVDSAQNPLLVAPTGAGKTAIASDVIRTKKDRHHLFLAHRRELIHQTRKHLADFDVTAGIILAGEPMDNMRGVQVASVQTISSRCMRGKMALPPADIIWIDEAHHCRANTYQEIVEAYPNARVVGMTATPCRKDGRGLGGTFNLMIETPQIEELIKLGHLVGTTVYTPSKPDLSRVHTRQGDYVESELAEIMDRAELVGDIVSHWHRLNPSRRKTVVFATNVKHATHLAEEFVKSGVRAASIDGKTPKPERDEILARLSRGDLDVIVNCMVLTEGWDQPDVSCLVLARPTKSMGLYRQMVGRGLRTSPGKTDCLVIDHAGAVHHHGFVEDPVYWSLDPDTKARTPAHEARQRDPASRLTTCSQCTAIRNAGEACPQCGFQPKRPAEYVPVIDGDLVHLERNGTVHAQGYTWEEKESFYRGLLYLIDSRGQKRGAAAHRYKDKFGEWPLRQWSGVGPIPPTAEVSAWDRHCRIKFAKSRQARSAA